MPRRTHSQNKYSAQGGSSVAVIPLSGAFSDHLVSLDLSPGRTQTLDFSFLSEWPQLQKVFLEYIRLLGDSVAPITKRSYYYGIKNFVMFLDQYEGGDGPARCETFDVDGHLLLNFKLWLETRAPLPSPPKRRPSAGNKKNENGSGTLAETTSSGIYHVFITLLKKVRSYRPELFPLLPDRLPVWRAARGNLKPGKEVLGVEDLKRILAAAKCETDRIRSQREQILKILKRTENKPVLPLHSKKPKNYWKSLDNIVHTLIRENGVGAAVPKNLTRCLTEHLKTFPSEIFGMYVPMGEASLLPFALQLYILTGLNVTSVITLSRDCVGNFPLPQYKKLIYDKPRSGSERVKSQLLPAKAAKSHAAATEDPLGIIEFILEWTEPLVPHAPEPLRNNLFLYRAGRGAGGTRVRAIPKYAAFERPLYEFRVKYRESHKLPAFCLRDLRAAVATYLYLQTRDIFRVQRFLGHSHIRTTINYVRGHIIAGEHDKGMAGAIEQMIRRILPNRGSVTEGSGGLRLPTIATVIEGDAGGGTDRAVRGGELGAGDVSLIRESGVMTLAARCRRPDQPPPFLNVPPGQICTMIDKCLVCPNAVVLEEDLPNVLLKIRRIWAERKRLSDEGWQILYADSWLTLNQVVRLFSKEAVERAKKRIEAESMLTLEG